MVCCVPGGAVLALYLSRQLNDTQQRDPAVHKTRETSAQALLHRRHTTGLSLTVFKDSEVDSEVCAYLPCMALL